MRNITFLSIFFIIIGCSSKIKTITAYEKINNELVKINFTEFNNNGNEIKQIRFGKLHDKVRSITYHNNLKKSMLNSFCFINNECDIQSFSNFTYEGNDSFEKRTMYVKDSLVWRIEEKRINKNFEVIKSYNWDVEATKIPNYEDAHVILDTLFYDDKNRLIKQVSYSKAHKLPILDVYTYSKTGYKHQTINTLFDSIYDYKYSKEQKIIAKRLPRYEFYFKELIYKIEYY